MISCWLADSQSVLPFNQLCVFKKLGYTHGCYGGPRAMREELTTLKSQFSTFKDSQRSQSLEPAAALLVPTSHFMNICGWNHTSHFIRSVKWKLNDTSLQPGRAETSRALDLQTESREVICSQQAHSCPWSQDGGSEQQCPGTGHCDK